eukprot:1845802-Amphidinium_carterae.1
MPMMIWEVRVGRNCSPIKQSLLSNRMVLNETLRSKLFKAAEKRDAFYKTRSFASDPHVYPAFKQ